jgi:HSP20 family molecular chaperone IbpA
MLYLTPWTRERANGCASTLQPLDLFGHFNETLNRYFAERPQTQGNQWGSSLRETEKEVLATFDAPGFEAGEFDVQIDDEAVTIAAEHRVKDGDTEIVERSFQRSFNLPSPVEADKVEAKYRNGVLELRFAKVELPRPRKIAVQNA